MHSIFAIDGGLSLAARGATTGGGFGFNLSRHSRTGQEARQSSGCVIAGFGGGRSGWTTATTRALGNLRRRSSFRRRLRNDFDRRGLSLFGGFSGDVCGLAFSLVFARTFALAVEAIVALLATALPALAAGFAASAVLALGARLTIIAAFAGLIAVAALLVTVTIPIAGLILIAITVAVLIPILVAVTRLITVAVAIGIARLIALFGANGGFLSGAVRGLLGGQEGGGLCAGFVFEIDVEALVRQFARGDVREGPLRLKRAQDAVIVFGVLLVVFSQNPVAGRRGVAGQLLIPLIDGLGVAPDLDVLGALRVPRTIRIGVVGVIRARLVPIASALTLHALEISHAR